MVAVLVGLIEVSRPLTKLVATADADCLEVTVAMLEAKPTAMEEPRLVRLPVPAAACVAAKAAIPVIKLELDAMAGLA